MEYGGCRSAQSTIKQRKLELAASFTNASRSRTIKNDSHFGVRWQNMAEIDFPTIIDTVLNETKQSKAYVIGHSMGTTIPFASLSENHSYDDKVS